MDAELRWYLLRIKRDQCFFFGTNSCRLTVVFLVPNPIALQQFSYLSLVWPFSGCRGKGKRGVSPSQHSLCQALSHRRRIKKLGEQRIREKAKKGREERRKEPVNREGGGGCARGAKWLNRDLKIKGRRQRRKRHFKSEFTFFQSSSWLFQLTCFVKCRWTLLELNT